MFTRLRSLVLAFLVLPVQIAAQEALVPGDRVRVEGFDGAVRVGMVIHAGESSLLMQPDSDRDSMGMPWSTVRSLEISGGQQRRFVRTMGITMGVTSLGVGAFSALGWSPCQRSGMFACMFHPASRSDAFTQGLVIGGLIGIPIGALAGLAHSSERWTPLDRPAQGDLRLSVLPHFGGGATIQLRKVLGTEGPTRR